MMTLPPYGLFSLGLKMLADHSKPMSDWRPEIPEVERVETFLEWRNVIRQSLGNTIWPYFDRTQNSWQGDSLNWAESSTIRELDVLIDEYQAHGVKIQEKPVLCQNPTYGDTHLNQFVVEDNPAEPAAVNIRDYVCDLTDDQYDVVRKIVDDAYSSRKLPGLFWLKQEFVRTRPYQAAFLSSRYDFANYRAFSAIHSSFYSGHCLEGIMISAAIAEEWLSDPNTFGTNQLDALARFAVDFGDRRVFAGVHYPSDNVGSWSIALRLIPNVFKRPDQVMDFVRHAITNHSQVFDLVKSTYSIDKQLTHIWNFLDKEIAVTSPTS